MPAQEYGVETVLGTPARTMWCGGIVVSVPGPNAGYGMDQVPGREASSCTQKLAPLTTKLQRTALPTL